MLQAEYGWIGYPLYAALIGGALSGMGVGVLMPFRGVPSLAVAVPRFQRRLAGASAALLAAALLLVAWAVQSSQLRM
jgi:hypothetical protein